MKENKRYYWIKLKTDFFNQETIDFLLSQPNGCEYIVLYQMLCLNTANSNGLMATKIGEMIVPYDVNKIVRDTKHFSFDTVAVALELFKRLGLIYEEDNRVLKVAHLEEMVGSESKWAEKKRLQRTKNVPLNNCKRLNGEMLRLPSGNTVFVDEKRYGGNGMLAYDLANGKCEMCGSEENLCIHHNNGYSNDIEDLYVLCRTCHSQVESGGVEIVHHRVHQIVRQENRDKSIENRDKILDKENKKERKKENYNSIIDELVSDDDIKDALLEFIKMRKLIKAPMTDRALKQLITKLFSLSNSKDEQIEILNNAIINNWKSIYPLKKETYSRQPVRKEIVPDWFNKDLKNEQPTEAEIKEMDDLIKEITDDDFEKEKKELQELLKNKY